MTKIRSMMLVPLAIIALAVAATGAPFSNIFAPIQNQVAFNIQTLNNTTTLTKLDQKGLNVLNKSAGLWAKTSTSLRTDLVTAQKMTRRMETTQMQQLLWVQQMQQELSQLINVISNLQRAQHATNAAIIAGFRSKQPSAADKAEKALVKAEKAMDKADAAAKQSKAFKLMAKAERFFAKAQNQIDKLSK